jgi:large subunit ribosomal protein L22
MTKVCVAKGRPPRSSFDIRHCFVIRISSFVITRKRLPQADNENHTMPYQATHRFARISARKVRPLADLIRGKYADEALDILRYQPHRGARLLEKVLKSALGNAESQRVQNPEGLVVTDARIDGGPMFKRIRPRARGMAFMIKKRMSHIRIALDEV